MSQASATSKLDAERARGREIKRQIAELHPALPHIPASFLRLIAILHDEAYSPAITHRDTWTQAGGADKRSRPPQRNELAIRELKRLRKMMEDMAAEMHQ